MGTKFSEFPAAALPLSGSEGLASLQAGENVLIPPNVVRTEKIDQSFTATSGQTVFTLTTAPYSITDGDMDIQLNGISLIQTSDYTISGGVITLLLAASAGDVLRARYF